MNADDSDINILLGSRSFYEGWDSNRPNVITFINIGMGADARKFVLQSVGRGVRIEPVRGQRQRLLPLYNRRAVGQEAFEQLKGHVQPLETLFIFGTDRNALQTIMEHLDLEQAGKDEHELALERNVEAIDDHPLLIPVYRPAGSSLLSQREPRRFEIASGELQLLRRYVDYLGDDRLFLAHHDATPHQVSLLRRVLSQPDTFFRTDSAKEHGSMRLLLSRLFGYFSVEPEQVERLKPLEDEIRHFRHIKVFLKDINGLQQAIDRVREAPRLIRELREQYGARQLSFEDLEEYHRKRETIPEAEAWRIDGCILHIKRIAQHYYHPILLSDDERIAFIRHIIHHRSEVEFLNALEREASLAKSLFAELDWWVFSKLDESLDEVYIPYYDPGANRIRHFKPDFIFWMQKGQDYVIAFIDPKGFQQSAYEHKVDGYKDLFLEADGTPKRFSHNGLCVRVLLFLYTKDASQVPQGYREFWYDRPSQIAERVLACMGNDRVCNASQEEEP